MSSEEHTIAHITSIINEYLKLESEIKELKKAIKERQYKYKLAEESILTFMNEDENIDSIKLSNNDDVIVPVEKSQTKTISRKNLMEIIENTLKDNDDLLNKIKKEMNSQTVVKKVSGIKVKKVKKKLNSSLSQTSAQSDRLLES